MVLNIGYRASNICLFEDGFLTYYRTVQNGVEQVINAICEEYGLRVEDARSVLLETPILYTDTREWACYGGKHFRLDRLSSSVTSNLRNLFSKIFAREAYRVDNIILTGWANNVNRIHELVPLELGKLQILNILRQDILESSLKVRTKY